MSNVIKNGLGEVLKMHETEHQKDDDTMESLSGSLGDLNSMKTSMAEKVSYPILSGEVGVVNKTYPYGNVYRYGAVGDKIADDSQAFLNAIACCVGDGTVDNSKTRILTGIGNFRLTQTINMRNIPVDMPFGCLFIDQTGIGVIMGGRANQAKNPDQTVYRIERLSGTDSNTTPTVRIIGAKGQAIRITSSGYIQLYADNGNTLDYSIAYAEFHFLNCTTLELTTSAVSQSWINENDFYLTRTTNLLVNGSYDHNHNRFYGGDFESGGQIRFDVGQNNRMYNIRGENESTSLYFGANTLFNIVEYSWISNINKFNEIQNGVTPNTQSVTDLGQGNIITYDQSKYNKFYPIIRIDKNVKVFDSTGNTYSTSLQNVRLKNRGIETFEAPQWTNVFSTGLIPVKKGTILVFKSDYSAFRPEFIAYDASRVLKGTAGITPIGGYVSATSAFSSETCYTTTVNTNYGAIIITDSSVGYVKVNAGTGNGTQLIKNVSIFATGNIDFLVRDNLMPFHNFQNAFAIPTVSASPTRGFAPVGYKTSNSAGGWFTCTFSLDTTTTASAASSQNIITLTSVTGIAINDVIGIEFATDDAEWHKVSAIAGNNITLDTNLTNAVNSGARVVLNRWINS